ncbi:hypothetical protein DJICPGNB_17520 [Escherichia coli]|nr:hypothetical protein DJICPGNB_17520 [Escherichia coli]
MELVQPAPSSLGGIELHLRRCCALTSDKVPAPTAASLTGSDNGEHLKRRAGRLNFNTATPHNITHRNENAAQLRPSGVNAVAVDNARDGL